MDWLNGMNRVMGYIEDHLTERLNQESLARMVGCSVYEFSRIFSFLTGMSVSEYIRRRRLSQAVFDIQGGQGKIVDIALKYGYESPASFTRAFKELHGTTPLSARGTGISLKTYPPMSFSLTMKGAESLNFRIEKRESLWAVFSITSPTGIEYVPAAYTKIMTEWFPASQYKRDEGIPNLEVFPKGNSRAEGYTWEIWMPVRPC